jgi:aryl-alcohol dehydrogenase-like predicted oxidoreductase
LVTSALAYLLSYDEVSAVIPGIRSMAQLESNFAADGQRLNEETRRQLEQFWDELTQGGKNLLPW